MSLSWVRANTLFYNRSNTDERVPASIVGPSQHLRDYVCIQYEVNGKAVIHAAVALHRLEFASNGGALARWVHRACFWATLIRSPNPRFLHLLCSHIDFSHGGCCQPGPSPPRRHGFCSHQALMAYRRSRGGWTSSFVTPIH